MLTAAFILVSCMLAQRHPADWTIRVDNHEGLSLVARVVADGRATFFALPTETDALAAVGNGAMPRSMSVATLDPLSCRPIAVVRHLRSEHTAISVTWGGAINSWAYDPSDYGADWGLSERLSPTNACLRSDPLTTPAPAASITTGAWLNRWEISCAARGPAEFVVRGEFLDGAVAGCQVTANESHRNVDEGHVAVWNVDGDPNRLAFAWRDRRCADGATISVLPGFERYSATVISIAGECGNRDRTYEAVFELTTPVEAESVDADLDLAGP